MIMKSFSLIIFFFSSALSAHPVIYKHGTVISSSNMPDYSNNTVMYSFSPRMAGGVEHWRFSRDQRNNDLGLAKINALIWRHNGEDSQANLYLHGGLGIEDREIGEKGTLTSGLLGAEADWESRVLYSSLKYYQFQTLAMTQARLGFSPRTAPFEDLQSWFMVQGMIIREIRDEVMITPMLRFFYHNVLWEFGSSTRGEWMLNLMVHY
jgi:hypothetical protein